MIDVRIADRLPARRRVAVDGGPGGDHHQLLRVGNRFAEGVRAAPTNRHRVAPLATTVNGQIRKQ
jgi:hypothetical protein